jgi:hypothetical protein
MAACGGTGDGDTVGDSPATSVTTADTEAAPSAPGCADVVDATISEQDGTFTIAATVSSADTGWDKYADTWEVRDMGGDVLGERVLTHPHESEQPFTRSLSGVVIPRDVAEVTIAARDSVAGFCGDVFVLEVPGR